MKKEFDCLCVWGTSAKKVGDEAQLASVLSYFGQHSPNVEITVLSRLSDKVLDILQQVGVRGNCLKLIEIFSVFRCLKNSDALVIIGGPFFEDWYQMFSISILFILAKITHTKIITFGATLFPVRTRFGKIFYRYIYSSISIISSRDDKAHEILRDLGVNKPLYPLADPRYMLQPIDKNRVAEILQAEGINPAKPYIAITTRYLHENMPDWVKSYHEFTPDIAQQSYANLAVVFSELSKSYQLVIVPMHPLLEDDFTVAEKLFSMVGSNCIVLNKRYTPFEIIGIFQGSQFSVQSRLGSTIFSVVANSPFAAISYENRMVDWMAANGMSEYCVDWRNIQIEEVVEMLRKLSENVDTIKEDFKALKLDKKSLFISQAENILDDLVSYR